MLRGGVEEALQYSHRVQLLFECLLERREALLPHDSLYNLGKGGAGNAVTNSCPRSLSAAHKRRAPPSRKNKTQPTHKPASRCRGVARRRRRAGGARGAGRGARGAGRGARGAGRGARGAYLVPVVLVLRARGRRVLLRELPRLARGELVLGAAAAPELVLGRGSGG